MLGYPSGFAAADQCLYNERKRRLRPTDRGLVVSLIFEFEIIDPRPPLCLTTWVDTPGCVVLMICCPVSAFGTTPAGALDKHGFTLAFAGGLWQDAERHGHHASNEMLCSRVTISLAEVVWPASPAVFLLTRLKFHGHGNTRTVVLTRNFG